jgi:hypothetical protein
MENGDDRNLLAIQLLKLESTEQALACLVGLRFWLEFSSLPENLGFFSNHRWSFTVLIAQ